MGAEDTHNRHEGDVSALTPKDATSAPPLDLEQEKRTTIEDHNKKPKTGHSPQFWIIILSLSLLAFISALDTMIIATALPTIVQEIGGETEYVWIANSFVFASAVPQPLVGQLANLYGRKGPILVSIVLFILGSGIGGGATDPGMLIAGRTIQGVGAGGIYVLIDIVCCDLVPLRERGKYLGIINAWAGVAAALGPVLGGVLAESNWRWIFYMNIPICALPLLTVTFLMHVKAGDGSGTIRDLDFLGSFLFIPSVIAVLWGLVTGGVTYPWDSWRVILPLVIGIVGWGIFHLHQHYWASNPSIPSRLFGNRTSASGFVLSFLGSVLIQAAGYFLPVYFQAVLTTTVSDSGVNFLPTAIGCLLFAAIGGIVMSKFGVYKHLHFAAFGLTVVGSGLFTLLDEDSPPVEWVFYQIILVAGLGMTISTILPAILAGLSQSDVAAASAVFSFIKTFGFVWGVTVSSVIFSSVFNENLDQISSQTLRNQLSDGRAYSFASQAHRISDNVPDGVWQEVTGVYITSLNAVWWFCLALSVLGFLIIFLERQLEMSQELNTEYGIELQQGDSLPSPAVSEERGDPLRTDGLRDRPWSEQVAKSAV